MTPLISIGISCYNASDTIDKAIGSALGQVWPNLEIIIVDDNSSDDSQEVLKNFVAVHPDIRVVFQKVNGGVAATRNQIIHEACGEFLVFFDDDDESDPERISKQYKRIISYENDFSIADHVICHTARLQKYSDGTERYEPTMGVNHGIAPNGASVALRTLTGKPAPNTFGSTATCSQMARLSTYKKLKAFDVSFRRSEDTEFNIRAALSEAHFVGLEEPLVIQKMTKAPEKTLSDEEFYNLKLIEKYQAFIGNYTSSQFCHDWLVAKYCFLKKKHLSFGLKVVRLFIMSPVLTLQRIKWALPNVTSNFNFKSFHDDKK